MVLTPPEADEPDLVVLVVVYRPRLSDMTAALQALLGAAASGCRLRVVLWHNDAGPDDTPGLHDAVQAARGSGLDVQRSGGLGNIGFGRAINAALQQCRSPYMLLLNQDAIPEPQAIEALMAAARADDPDVAAWEMRQVPYEHPKDYDPLTLDTVWCSAAAVLLRGHALRQIRGFEPRFFMYCEDVDLSWRLRCDGWRIRYLPWCAAVHHTYSEPGEIKPLAVTQGCYANLCIRARYAGWREVAQGIRQLLHELRGPQAFPGRRAGLIKALAKFAWNYPYFRLTRRATPGFTPCIAGWDYEMRRNGVFYPFRSARGWGANRPTVAVLVDTREDRMPLAERLTNLRHQTYRPLVVVCVGPGPAPNSTASPGDGQPLQMVSEPDATLAQRRLDAAGIRWLVRAPTDAQLWYADHVEVLLQAALDEGKPHAAAEVWQFLGAPGAPREGHRLHVAREVLAPTHPVALACALTDIRRLPATADASSLGPAWADGDVAAVARVTQVRYPPAA